MLETMISSIQIVARILAGGVFLVAAAAKGMDFAWFVSVVRKYRFLPDGAVALASAAMVAAEALIGGCLVLALLLPWSAYAALCLVAFFSALVVITLWRGISGIECGCLAKNTRVSGRIIIRNAGLAGLTWLSASTAPIAIPSAAAVVCVFLFSLALFLSPFYWRR